METNFSDISKCQSLVCIKSLRGVRVLCAYLLSPWQLRPCPDALVSSPPPPNIQGVFLRRECAKVWASRMLWEAVCSEVYHLKKCLRGSIGEGRMVEFAKVFCSLEAFVT